MQVYLKRVTFYQVLASLNFIDLISLFYSSHRMMSGPVFLLPPLTGIDRFFVRLDADSHITRPVTKRTDPLGAAAQGGHAYVFWSVALESCRLEFEPIKQSFCTCSFIIALRSQVAWSQLQSHA